MKMSSIDGKRMSITAYNVSYIMLAEGNALILVTEDKKLRTKAENLLND